MRVIDKTGHRKGGCALVRGAGYFSVRSWEDEF
jgi:hypothetical protein